MPERHPTQRVIALPDVRFFVAERFFGALAHSLLHATIAWHLWKASGSYAVLGWLGAVEFAPVIPASLLAGALADAWDRRRIVLIAQCAATLGGVALYFVSTSGADR